LNRLIFVPILLLALVDAAPAWAGAWTREAGGWFFKFGYDRWHTEERFDPDGRRIPFEAPDPGFDDPTAYRSDALRLYGEYGLAEGLTVSAAASLERVEAEGRNILRRSTGPGDVTLTLRQKLAGAPVVSAEAHVQIPAGDASGPGPALGSGHADFGGRVLVGASTATFYVTGGAGYTLRGGTRADEFQWGIEAGHAIRSDATLRAELRGAMTPDRASDGSIAFDPALAESGHLTGSLGVVLGGEPFDLVLAIDHVLDGTNTLAGTRLSVSIWAQR
jgi:hypothetical protein